LSLALIDRTTMDKTPSLTRALIGLTLLIAAIVGGYLALKAASDSERQKEVEEDTSSIRFVRSGGIAGRTAVLVLDESGSGRVTEDAGTGTKTKRVDLTARDRTRLATAFEAAGWPDDEELYPPGGCADCYQYDITYSGVHVRLFDPIPVQYRRVVRVVGSVLDRELKN
jgi:hypothetical protein